MTMEPEEHEASSSCQRSGSLSSVQVLWEGVNPALPDCSQTTGSQILDGHKRRLQRGFPLWLFYHLGWNVARLAIKRYWPLDFIRTSYYHGISTVT